MQKALQQMNVHLHHAVSDLNGATGLRILDAILAGERNPEELVKLRDEKLLRPIPGLGYRQYPRLREEVGSLSGSVSRTITRPTDSQARRTTELVTETGTVQKELQGIVDGRIAKLNALLKNLPHIIVRGGAIM